MRPFVKNFELSFNNLFTVMLHMTTLFEILLGGFCDQAPALVLLPDSQPPDEPGPAAASTTLLSSCWSPLPHCAPSYAAERSCRYAGYTGAALSIWLRLSDGFKPSVCPIHLRHEHPGRCLVLLCLVCIPVSGHLPALPTVQLPFAPLAWH